MNTGRLNFHAGAIHEAGHCIVALALGYPVRSVELKADGAGVCITPGVANDEHAALIGFAGGLSVCMFFDQSFDEHYSRGDLKLIADGGFSATKKELLREHSGLILNEHRNAVFQVAGELERHRYIGRNGLQNLCGDWESPLFCFRGVFDAPDPSPTAKPIPGRKTERLPDFLNDPRREILDKFGLSRIPTGGIFF